MYYSHTKYYQRRKSLPSHCLLFVWEKKKKAKVFCVEMQVEIQVKNYLRKHKKGAPADLEKT